MSIVGTKSRLQIGVDAGIRECIHLRGCLRVCQPKRGIRFS